MAATFDGRQRLARGAHTALRARRTAAEALPEPDEEWRRSEVSDALADSLNLFEGNGIVEIVRTEFHQDTGSINVYRTTQIAAAYVDSLDDIPGPCPHTGVRCVDADAGVYTCLDEDCDVRFDRETAREVMGR
jgi:hypothetical protein